MTDPPPLVTRELSRACRPGFRVDLVTRAGLRAELRERIEREAQLLICYGKTSVMPPCIPTQALHEQGFGGDRPLPQGVR